MFALLVLSIVQAHARLTEKESIEAYARRKWAGS